jgi:hypothetical protein
MFKIGKERLAGIFMRDASLWSSISLEQRSQPIQHGLERKRYNLTTHFMEM